MSREINPVLVRILEKEYRVGCPEGEQEALLAAARLLDRKMREIRDGGRVIGTDRIAVMAALNIAHELLDRERVSDHTAQTVGRRIRSLQEKIDLALHSGEPLEL